MSPYKKSIRYLITLQSITERAAAGGLVEILFKKDASEIAYDVLKQLKKVKIETLRKDSNK